MTDFYISKSPLFSIDQRVPICKDCVISNSLNDDGSINELALNKILRQIDRPYYKDLIESAKNRFLNEHSYVENEDVDNYGKDILKAYFTLIAMRQDRDKSYSDSEKDNFIHRTSNSSKRTKHIISQKYNDLDKAKINTRVEQASKNENFCVTQDMIETFGEGYTNVEYKKMSKKYKDMCETYVIQTSIHKEALITYVRFKVKEELATAKGDVVEAQKWYSAAQDAAEKAKLTPKQISKEDLQGGIVNFSDIFRAVEGAKERIKIFPEFKYQPKDAPDFIIWCYLNYERNLHNLPEVSYYDVYKFYDEKKKEYVEMYGDPYGIFEDDTSESNRETIQKFITIPPEFMDGN